MTRLPSPLDTDMDTSHETGQKVGITTRPVKDKASGQQSGSARTTARGGKAPEELPGRARSTEEDW